MNTSFYAVLLSVLAALFSARAADVEPDEPDGGGHSADPSVIDGKTADARRNAFVRYCATAKARSEFYPKESMAYCVARLILNADVPYAQATIEKAAAKTLEAAQAKLRSNKGDSSVIDPFDKHALLNAYLICPEKFPPAAVQKIKQFIALHAHREWRGFGSANYRLMRDGSGFLAAEQWADLKDADGLDAEQIKAATRKRLYGYFDTIVRKNIDEYNGPTYYATDLMAIRMLAEFSKDAEMKTRAGMTLDWLMIDLACMWNQGYAITTCGRSKGWGCIAAGPDSPDGMAAIGWMFFGGKRGIRAAGACPHHAFWMAYPGAWKLPEIVTAIAQDRAAPFATRASVLSIGQHDIRQYTWHSPSFGLASQWELAPKPSSGLYKETKRQVLKWVSDKPVSTFSVQQENPRRPYALNEHVKNAFGYGESPFAQLLQFETTQVGVYAVPEDYEFYKFYAPFTKQGAIAKRIEKDGWVLCHCGAMLFAFRSLQPAAWGKPERDCDVLWCDQRKGAWVLETTELNAFAGGGADAELERFAAALRAKTKIDASLDAPAPKVTYTALSGHVLEIQYRPHGQRYGGQHRIDGKSVEYTQYPLLENPWVHQDAGGALLKLTHGALNRSYDFETWCAR